MTAASSRTRAPGRRPRPSRMTDGSGRPVRSLAVADVDLDRGEVRLLAPREAGSGPADGVFALVWFHGQPLGELTVLGVPDQLLPGLVEQARRQLLFPRWQHLLHDALSTPRGLDTARRQGLAAVVHPDAPEDSGLDVTVAICTRDRPESLRLCLRAVAALTTPVAEVLVVDNASRDDRTREVVAEFPGVRYVREPRRGLDWARNRALLEARSGIVAFTDDDTEPHEGWIAGLLRAFREEPTAVCITGLVTPRELATPAQVLFEHVGGFGRGYRRLWFSAAVHDGELAARALARAGWPGTGANMAFRRQRALELGGFDTAMDVGTPTGGGGDLEMFFRVVADGGLLVYEPSAVVRHVHRADMPGLLRQMRGNGTGSYAYFLGAGQRYGAREARQFRRLAAHAVVQHHLRGLAGALKSRGRMPLSIRAAESRGAWDATTRSYYARAQQQAAAELQQHGGPVTAPAVHPATARPGAAAPDPVVTVELGEPGPVSVREPAPARDGRRVRVQVLQDGALQHTVTCRTSGSALSPARLRWELVDQLGPALLQPGRAACGPVGSGAGAPLAVRWAGAPALPAEELEQLTVDLSGGTAPPGPSRAAGPSSATVLLHALDREEHVERCLARLGRQQTSRSVEVLVVRTADGVPDRGPTAAGADGTVLLTSGAPRWRALAPALQRAAGEVLVLLDADLDVADDWLDRLLEPFDDPAVAVVTGPVRLPELDALDSQVLLDHGGLDAGPHRLRLGPEVLPGALPAWAGSLASAAVRAQWASTPADHDRSGSGGGDADFLSCVLEAGGRVQYEPRARAQRRSRLDRRAVSEHLRARTAEQAAHRLRVAGRVGPARGWRLALAELPGEVLRQVRAARLGDEPLPAFVVLAQVRGIARGVRQSVQARAARTDPSAPAQ